MHPTTAQRVQYLAFRALEGGVSGRTWDQRIALGRGVGRLWHLLDGAHRKLARKNLHAAFPDWPTDRVAAAVRSNFEHLGATAAEFLGIAGETSESILARCRTRGKQHLDAALSRGRGVFLLTGHLGNWELQPIVGGALGYATYGVARRIQNPLVDQRVRSLRENFGARIIPHRNSVRPILKAARGGGVVGFLMDQRALAREGVTSEFFGRPVSTNQGLALLALKSGTPVVPGFDRRLPDGRHEIQLGPALEPPAEGDRDERVRHFTRTFDATIEAAVRRCPEQWFWIHRRWKLPGGMTR